MESTTSSATHLSDGDDTSRSSDYRQLYQSIHTETHQPTPAKIKGEVPKWINGSLYRNGPGLFEVGEQVVGSFFDGFALLHRFIIKDGNVSYQSRYLECDAYKLAKSEQRLVLGTFGTAIHRDPCKSYFRHVFSYFQKPMYDPTDNCNVNWLRLGHDDLYALTESNLMCKVDPETLEVTDKVPLRITQTKVPGSPVSHECFTGRGESEVLETSEPTAHAVSKTLYTNPSPILNSSWQQIDITKYVAVNTATAHPHYGDDGVVYNMGTSFGMKSNYNIVKMVTSTKEDNANPLEKATVLCSIPASTYNPSYFHSFALTKNYVVFLEQPLYVNVLKMLTCKLRETAPSSSLEFYPEEKCRFHLVNVHTGQLITTKYLADSFFCFHFINAYEDQDHVVVDLCRHADGSIIEYATLEAARAGAPSLEDNLQPVRFVLPLNLEGNSENLVTLTDSLATAKLVDKNTLMCKHEVLCEATLELPQINYKNSNGRPYRYIYGLPTHLRQISKVDTKSKTNVLWGSKSGTCYPSEPVFVPNPDGVEEDDGVVLSLVTDVSPPKSTFLVVLDAKTLQEVARAEVKDLPFGIHGMFVDGIN